MDGLDSDKKYSFTHRPERVQPRAGRRLVLSKIPVPQVDMGNCKGATCLYFLTEDYAGPENSLL